MPLNNSLNNKHYTITSHAFTNNIIVSKSGNICVLTIAHQLNKNVAYGNVLCTVPDEFKPVGTFYGWGRYEQQITDIELTPDGNVLARCDMASEKWLLATIIYLCK